MLSALIRHFQKLSQGLAGRQEQRCRLSAPASGACAPGRLGWLPPAPILVGCDVVCGPGLLASGWEEPAPAGRLGAEPKGVGRDGPRRPAGNGFLPSRLPTPRERSWAVRPLRRTRILRSEPLRARLRPREAPLPGSEPGKARPTHGPLGPCPGPPAPARAPKRRRTANGD